MGKKINSNIFDNSNEKILKKWGDVYSCTKNLTPHALMLIHTVRHVHTQANRSPLLNQDAESAFNSWDVISTSLIEYRSKYIRSQWANVGLLLAVPPQNIIGTFTEDVSFQNHAGIKENNSFALAENYFNGIPKNFAGKKGKERFNYIREHLLPNKSYAHITTPEHLIKNRVHNKYNEVLVVGKSNVNIHAGFPPTGHITVCGIYHLTKFGNKADPDDEKLVGQLKILNPDLPVIRQEVY
jgi:hypothetical protein